MPPRHANEGWAQLSQTLRQRLHVWLTDTHGKKASENSARTEWSQLIYKLLDLKNLDFDLGLTGFDEQELARLLAAVHIPGTNRMSLRIDPPELAAPVVENTLIWERVVK